MQGDKKKPETDGFSEEKTLVASGETIKKHIHSLDEMAPPVLVVLLGPTAYQGQQFALGEGHIIGRAHEAKIFIDDRSLSRSHARVEIRDGEVYLVDLGSTNKTLVNGKVLHHMAPCLLKNNDQIQTGNVIFKFLEKGSIEALSNQRLLEKANRDALTGAYSKGALLERAPEAMKRAETLGEHLCLLVFDIDHFKKINDTYGHPCGDYVLKELGALVGSNLIRSEDFFARYGGEEFVLLLANTSLQTGREIAERIRITVEASEFIFEGKKIAITISLGLCEKLSNDSDWTKFFDRADKALYVSKQSGRNRLTVV